MDDEYKAVQEAFVSGHTGSSLTEIVVIAMVPTVYAPLTRRF